MYIVYSSDFKADIFISLNCKMFVTLPYEVCREPEAETMLVFQSGFRVRWSDLHCLVMESLGFFVFGFLLFQY